MLANFPARMRSVDEKLASHPCLPQAASFAYVDLGSHGGRVREGFNNSDPVETDLVLIEFRYDCYDRWTANNRKAVSAELGRRASRRRSSADIHVLHVRWQPGCASAPTAMPRCMQALPYGPGCRTGQAGEEACKYSHPLLPSTRSPRCVPFPLLPSTHRCCRMGTCPTTTATRKLWRSWRRWSTSRPRCPKNWPAFTRQAKRGGWAGRVCRRAHRSKVAWVRAQQGDASSALPCLLC